MAEQTQCFPRDGSATRAHELEDWSWRDDPCYTHVCGSCGHHAHIDRSDGTILQNMGRCQCGWTAGNDPFNWQFPGMGGAEMLEMMGEQWEDDY